jgi:hypothetical protein
LPVSRDMPNAGEDILTDMVQQLSAVKRKTLLPWWIKVFMWIFMVLGIIAPVGLIFALSGYPFQLSLYGLSTNGPLSAMGMFITALFLFKGITAFGLFRETDWAVKWGIADAVSGMVICVLVMLFPEWASGPGSRFSFPFELLLLIPYLGKLLKIKPAWENAVRA